jgi:hypothetical protein
VHRFPPTLIRCEHRREGKARLFSPPVAPLSLLSPRTACHRCYTESHRRAPLLQLHSWVPSSCARAVRRRALSGPSSPVSLRFPSATDTLSMAAPSGHSPQSPPMPPAPPQHRIAHRPINWDHRPFLQPVTDGSPSPELP